MGRAILISTALAAACVSQAQDTPQDRVSAFLEDAGLNRLLETQLFDRLRSTDDQSDRVELAARLSTLYMRVLQSETSTEEDLERARAQAKLLLTLVPGESLLSLRLEVAVQEFRLIESRAELERVGLLDDALRAQTVPELVRLERELFEIASTAQRLYTVRQRARGATSEESVELTEALLAVRSRAFFALGWSGYARAVVDRARVPDHVFARFGWLLGFEGSLPVLAETDQDLLRYDHVARAALGVAQCMVQNNDYAQARVWLDVIIAADQTPEPVKSITRRRLAETLSLERDWIGSIRVVRSLLEDDEMSIQTARIALASPLRALRDDSARRTQGGDEGAKELARILLTHLVDDGHFAHVLELSRDYDLSSYLGSGFLSGYSAGLKSFERAELDSDPETYASAADLFSEALEHDDASVFEQYREDAVRKLSIALLRSDQPERARRVLERAFERAADEHRERVLWLLIAATDDASRAASAPQAQALKDRLVYLVNVYLSGYPQSGRATTLVMTYSDRIDLPGETVIPTLRSAAGDDERGLSARRLLVLYLLENKEDHSDAVIIEELHKVIVDQPERPGSLIEARQRVRVATNAIEHLIAADSDQHALIERLLSDATSAVGSFPTLVTYARELEFRRIQWHLSRSMIDDAVSAERSANETLDDLAPLAGRLIFLAAWDALESGAPEHASHVLDYGQPIIASFTVSPDDRLSRDQSVVCERVAHAAIIESSNNPDNQQRLESLALGLGVRVFEHGEPSIEGLVRTAGLLESSGDGAKALDVWNTIVVSVPVSDPRWGMARHQSLTLMVRLDDPRLEPSVNQYRVLYPDGVDEPWGSRISELLSAIETREEGAP